jgi:hypothetical protein
MVPERITKKICHGHRGVIHGNECKNGYMPSDYFILGKYTPIRNLYLRIKWRTKWSAS